MRGRTSMAKPFKLMPGPKAFPVFGSVFEYSRFGKYSFDRLHLAKKDYLNKFGKICKEQLGPVAKLVQVFDPDDAATVFRADGKHPMRTPLPITIAAHKRDNFTLGLGSLNGDEWYSLRSAVQKLLMRPRAAASYLPAQNDVADDFIAALQEQIKENNVVDVHPTLLKYAMESIGTVCFTSRLGCMRNQLEDGSMGKEMLHASSKMFEAVQNTTLAFPWYMIFRTKMYNQFVEGKRVCDGIARGFLQQSNETSPDASAQDASNSCPNFMMSLVNTGRLSSEQVVEMCMELFTAGIDSTANALSFVLYNLSKNPAKQNILAEEILSVLPKGATVTAEAIESLPYLKACVKESFRLNFPVEGGTVRILQDETVLSGFQVPKGTIVAMNHQTMCLQEEHFERPKEYIPERWLKTGSATLKPPPKFVMIPFGHGPRMCIGRRFAEQEIYLAIIKLLQHFKLEYSGEEIGMLNRIFTMPDKPLRITFKERLQ